MADATLRVVVAGDTRKLNKSLGDAESRLAKFGRTVGGKKGGMIGGALGGVGKTGLIGAGVAAGAAVATKALSSAIAKAKEAQVAQARLAQAFESAGVSTAKYGAEVENAIQQTSKLAGVDDELASDSYANLLRTTGSVAKATRGLALAANIARARNISLAAATKIVEKAENGQLRGLKMVGVGITKNMTSTEALAAAQRKFAGSAERYGKTAAGAQARLNVAFENLQERVGAKLLPLLTKLSLRLIDLIDWSEKNWPAFSKAIGDAYRDAKPVIDNIIRRIEAIGQAVKGVVNIIRGIKNGEWSDVWRGMKDVAAGYIKLLVESFVKLPLLIAKSLGQAAWDGVEKLFQAGLNRLIGIVNAAIRAYNKIPLVPNIPTIGTVGGGPKAAPSSTGGRADEGTRGLSGTQTVNLVVDGQVLATTVIAHSARIAKQTAGTTSGRSPYR